MNASAWKASLIVSEALPMDGRLFNTADNMISIRSPRHKLLSSPLSSLTSPAERRITSSAYYPRITEPFQACWFVSSGVLTVTISPQCPALQKTESSVKVKLKDTLRRQYVPSARASTRSNRPPQGPKEVTLEISDRLSSHLLYKYSMCSKDNLACAARRENEGCRAQEKVVVVVLNPVSRTLQGAKGCVRKISKYLKPLICPLRWRMALITESERSDNLKEQIVASLQVCKWTIGPWGRRRVMGC